MAIEKIPFRVSAKTARLIGRENISDANGAVGELVKNAYDADATACVIAFVPFMPSAPKTIDSVTFARASAVSTYADTIYKVKPSGSYTKRAKVKDEDVDAFLKDCSETYDLWIADNGRGMGDEVIRQNWMTIGTDFKEVSPSSEGGRRRTGAKGIGRFAMDKLAHHCRLYSFPKDETTLPIVWKVSWDAFEDSRKTLDQVKATIGPTRRSIKQVVKQTHKRDEIYKPLGAIYEASSSGTILQLRQLREDWTERDLLRLRKFLSTLAPPSEQRLFQIILLDSRFPELSGPIVSPVLDDFDYRLSAKIRDGEITLIINRNELREDEIDPDVFKEKEMKIERFSSGTIQARSHEISTTFKELFPRASADRLKSLHDIGDLDFSLSFYKRGRGGKKDTFPYRAFQAGIRKTWLDEHGGIKIYRDGFFVRPYGDPKGKSFDWLGLGERVAGNPAGAGRKGWRVNPQQVVGTVSLSGDRNPKLRDQANREGIIDSSAFEALQILLKRLIQEFEDDRSYILSNIKKVKDRKNKEQADLDKAEEDAANAQNDPDATEREKRLAQAVTTQREELKDQAGEMRSLQSLATLGTVLISFTHEVTKTRDRLSGRNDTLTRLLEKDLPREKYLQTNKALNPYYWLSEADEVDKSVSHWFDFALKTLKGDRRRRSYIKLRPYLKSFQETWLGFFEARKVSFDVEWVDDCEPVILAFQIDLDSIFHNLVLNTIEAVVGESHVGERKINVSIKDDSSAVNILYRDNGPGLSKSISPPTRILDFNYSTKIDDDGNPSGTGIGLWILDSVVSSYGGKVSIPDPEKMNGFGLDMRIPSGKEKSGE